MFEEELRQSVINSGLSAYEIAKRAAAADRKVSHQAIKRFIDRKPPGLSLSSAAIIADVLGLAVVKRGETPLVPKYEVKVSEEAEKALTKIIQQMEKLQNMIRISAGKHAHIQSLSESSQTPSVGK